MSTFKVNRAISNIEDDIETGEPEPDETLAEKFDTLGQEIISDAYDIILRCKKSSSYRITADDEYQQATKVKQFNIISTVFTKLKKQGRITDHINEDFDRQLLQKIKEKRSTVGNIVRNINEIKPHE